MRTIILLTAFLVLGLSTAQAQNAYYRVKFPNDTTIVGCGASADTIYPEIMQYPGCSFNVGVSVKDQVFNITQNGGCKKILRTWTLIYWCAYDPNEPWPIMINNPPDTDIGPTVFGIPDNRGHLQYVQIIKVLDNDAPVFLDCPDGPVEFCDYTGNDPDQYHDNHVDLCEGPVDFSIKVTDSCSAADIKLSYRFFLDLDGNGSMETFVSSSSPNAWPIETMVLGGDTLMGTIDFPAGFGLPYGNHKIEWIANDQCGNESICKYEFSVQDCKAPTVVCINGLSINIMQTGMITLWDTDFIQYMFDNCTPTDQLKVGIRKSGTGTGFPVDTHSVTFDCSELGPQLVEIWAEDAYGNADYCETYVIVQDNMGSCPPSNKFTGTVSMAGQKPVSGATITLKKSNTVKAVVQTDDNGIYEIGSMPAGCNYKLIPSFDDAPAKAGINTLDALLIGGQMDAVMPLASPYKLLAADVDNDGTLTHNDIQQIVDLVLGMHDDFPDKPVWQFMPADYVFPDPDQPWAASVPATSNFFCLSGPISAPFADFIGVKTGDVNGSVSTNFQGTDANDRQKDNQVVFKTSDQVFSSGQEIRVDIVSPDLAALVGFQYTLDFDTEILSLVDIEPGLVPAEYTATPDAGHVTTSWHSTTMLDPTVIGKNMHLRTYTLVFQTLQRGTLSQALQMTSSVTPAEAYARNLQTQAAVLNFSPIPVGPKDRLALLPVWPNPAKDQFRASYYLPDGGTTSFTLTDAQGTVLETRQSYQEKGYHQTTFDLKGNTTPGLLFLRLEGPGGVEVQRVLKL
ncbi:MAG: T9SS type A sorting domain-containing protein [Bacteroidetes bacterium]|nr:MAG: T9SS type A sorting domain-containing protein [Bacteroidota bacterium]